MHLQISKWGNSLAVRIPAEYVRRMGLADGEQVEASMTADGTLMLRKQGFDRKQFAKSLKTARASMPLGDSIIDDLRHGEGVRY